MKSSQADAPLSTGLVGDVVAVHFSQEDEVALFLPQAGDVLLCSLAQWQQLADTTASPTALARTLVGLGANLHESLTP